MAAAAMMSDATLIGADQYPTVLSGDEVASHLLLLAAVPEIPR